MLNFRKLNYNKSAALVSCDRNKQKYINEHE